VSRGPEPEPRPGRHAGAGPAEQPDQEFLAALEAAQAGQDWAVAVLFRRHNPRLLRYLRAQAPEVAEDLASEVWMAMARQLVGFEGDERAFRAWMFTIARRRVIQHWRQKGRRRTSPAPNEVFFDRAAPDDPSTEGLQALSAQDAVAALAAHLPPDQVEVVLLRVVAGLSVEEVAEMVGKSPGAVRVTQHRALRRLAEHFSPEAVTG